MVRKLTLAAAVLLSTAFYWVVLWLGFRRVFCSSGPVLLLLLTWRRLFWESCRSGFEIELGTFELPPSLALAALFEPFPLPREDVEYLDD